MTTPPADHEARRIRGLDAARDGRWTEALDALTPLVGTDADSTELALVCARAWDREGDSTKAFVALERAVDLDPDHGGARCAMARRCRKDRQLARALEHANRAVSLRDDTQGRVVRFEVHAALKRHREAMADLEAALVVGATPSLRRRAAETYLGHRDAEAALHHAAAGASLSEEPRFLELQNQALLRLRRFDEALSLALDQLKKGRRPRFWVARVVAAGGVEEVCAWLADNELPGVSARLCLWRGDEPGARALAQGDDLDGRFVRAVLSVLAGEAREGWVQLDRLRSELTRRPDPDGWITADAVLCWMSEASSVLGDHGRAEALAAQAMEVAQTYNVAAHTQRLRARMVGLGGEAQHMVRGSFAHLADKLAGLAAPRSHRSENLREELDAVFEALAGNRSPWPTRVVGGGLRAHRTPEHPRHEARLREHLLKTRSLDETLERFEALQTAHPDKPTPHTYAGETLLWEGEYDRAIQCFERAIEIRYTTTWAWIGWGAAVLLQGDAPRALELFEEGVRATLYEGPTLFVYRGEAYLALGELERAAADLDVALAAKPHRMGAWLLRALVAANQGHEEPARQVATMLRSHSHGLWLDLAEHRGLEPQDPDLLVPDVLELALGWMRGNRSSTLVTYQRPGCPRRFGVWGRYASPKSVFGGSSQRSR